jgi:hypothetical protein
VKHAWYRSSKGRSVSRRVAPIRAPGESMRMGQTHAPRAVTIREDEHCSAAA